MRETSRGEVLFESVSRHCRLLVRVCCVFPVLSCWCRKVTNRHVMSATVKVVRSGMLDRSHFFPKILLGFLALFSETSSCFFQVGKSMLCAVLRFGLFTILLSYKCPPRIACCAVWRQGAADEEESPSIRYTSCWARWSKGKTSFML